MSGARRRRRLSSEQGRASYCESSRLGEDVLETLKREVLEEVGLEIKDSKKYLKDFTFIRPDGYNVVGFSFEVTAKSENVNLSKDFEDYKWVSPEELMKLDYIPKIEGEVNIAFG